MRVWIRHVCSHFVDVQEATAGSHSSAESKIISFDAGFRMDG